MTGETDLGGIPPVVLVVAVAAVTLVLWVLVLVFFLYRSRVAGTYRRGLRGTAVVVQVVPTPLLNRRSVVEHPTEMVVLATRDRPRGVRPEQKVPAGQYRPGQVVPVVQRAGDPDSVRLDRPDLESSDLSRWGLGAMLVALPVIAVRGVLGVLGGG